MPQKPIYSRYPLMNSVQSGLSRGLVRTESGELISLYRKLNEFTGSPYTWEGAFSLACLICDHPADEPSAKAVIRALADTEDGLPHASVSVGIVHGTDAANAENLFEKTDAAMYRAKQGGKSTFRFYHNTPERNTTAS